MSIQSAKSSMKEISAVNCVDDKKLIFHDNQ